MSEIRKQVVQELMAALAITSGVKPDFTIVTPEPNAAGKAKFDVEKETHILFLLSDLCHLIDGPNDLVPLFANRAAIWWSITGDFAMNDMEHEVVLLTLMKLFSSDGESGSDQERNISKPSNISADSVIQGLAQGAKKKAAKKATAGQSLTEDVSSTPARKAFEAKAPSDEAPNDDLPGENATSDKRTNGKTSFDVEGVLNSIHTIATGLRQAIDPPREVEMVFGRQTLKF
ncbi:uncharacterized protein MEPE_04787 [Melanopsichium pennsylvanicum]|uniref:Uncharacterized protein n=2 Tax=Melanopsichium pennsylvanicum TaxID=63383 RepID=A0AAJ4XS43_9BASI